MAAFIESLNAVIRWKKGQRSDLISSGDAARFVKQIDVCGVEIKSGAAGQRYAGSLDKTVELSVRR